MSEEAQYYYGGKKIIRQVMGFMMFVIEIIWLGNHLNGGAKYLAYVTQLPDVTCKIITVLASASTCSSAATWPLLPPMLFSSSPSSSAS